MADYKQLFKTTENQNWLKVAVAIHITKTGLTDFVTDAAVKLRDKIINDIQQGTNLPTGTRCNKCNTCPEANCEKFRQMIKTCHRFHGPKSGPSWKNTHSNDWCTKPWEVAKCFFPGDGYLDKLNAQETDFNGIVGFILNSMTFDGQTGENLSDIKGNKFSKCRQFVNIVRHSATLEVKDADRIDYITQLKDLLKSGSVLQNDKKADEAHGQLLLLENDKLTITTDDIVKVIENILEETKQLISKANEVNNEASNINANTRDLQTKLETLNDIYKHAVEDIEKQKQDAIKGYHTHLNDCNMATSHHPVDVKYTAHSRIVILLMKCTATVHRRVLQTYLKQSGQPIEQLLMSKKKAICNTQVGRLNEAVLYPIDNQPTHIETWDLSLLCCVLSKAPLQQPIKEDVKQLRELRNKICHSKNACLDQTEYQSFRADIMKIVAQALAYVNDKTFEEETYHAIDEVEHSSLLDGVHIYISMMNQWYALESDIRDSLGDFRQENLEEHTTTRDVLTTRIKELLTLLRQTKQEVRNLTLELEALRKEKKMNTRRTKISFKEDMHVVKSSSLKIDYNKKIGVKDICRSWIRSVHVGQKENTDIRTKVGEVVRRIDSHSCLNPPDAVVTVENVGHPVVDDKVIEMIQSNIQQNGMCVTSTDDEWKHAEKATKDVCVDMEKQNQPIVDTESGSIRLIIRCKTFPALASLFDDCTSGKLTERFKPLETAIRKLPGFEAYSQNVVMRKADIMNVLDVLAEDLSTCKYTDYLTGDEYNQPMEDQPDAVKEKKEEILEGDILANPRNVGDVYTKDTLSGVDDDNLLTDDDDESNTLITDQCPKATEYQSKTIKAGEMLELAVPLGDIQDPKVTWYRGPDDVSKDKRYIIETDHCASVLQLHHAIKDDSGEYRVSTERGTIERFIVTVEDNLEDNLTKINRPKVPTYVSSMSRKEVITAIDFGTTYSGYAFGFGHPLELDKIRTNSPWSAKGPWSASRLSSLKTPTVLLLDPKKIIVAFGFEAEDQYAELCLDNKHHKYYYFRYFRMKMQQTLTMDTLLEDEGGKTMKAMEVYSICIKYMKEHFYSRIRMQNLDIRENNIAWVLTIPAKWNEAGKLFMMKAAEMAGITSDSVSIAFECEASAAYFTQCPVHTLNVPDLIKSKMPPFTKGDRYMVVDIGGGTIDTSVHEVGHSETQIWECDSTWLGIGVDALERFMENLIGNAAVDKFKRDYVDDWLEIRLSFELIMRREKYRLKIPNEIVEIYKSMKQTNVGVVTKEQVDLERFLKGDYEAMRSLLKWYCDIVVEHLQGVFAQKDFAMIKTIFVVGGLSDSPIIQGTLEQKFRDKTLIIPKEADVAMVKGAVILGQSCDGICCSPVARYSYGLKVCRDFIEGKHPRDKKQEVDGSLKCKDIFSKCLEMGQSIPVGQACSRYAPVKEDQQIAVMDIYRAEEKNPHFVTDAGVSHEFTLKVDVPGHGKGRGIWVTFFFGRTEITVVADSEGRKQSCSVKLDYSM